MNLQKGRYMATDEAEPTFLSSEWSKWRYVVISLEDTQETGIDKH
jgi:hypothetical protein